MSSRKVRSLIVSKLWSVDWVELSCLSIQSFFQHTPRNTSNLDELQVTLVSPVRVSSSILVDRTELFLYLDSFAVTIIRSVLCGRCLFLFSMSCLFTAVVCIYARWALLYHSSSRNCDCIFSRSWCVDVDTVTDSTSILPLHELWMFFSWECCHQCVRLPKLPRTDNWIISHHFWHYFGRATVPRKRPFCDPPGQSICSRPTLDFSWNRRGHIGLRGPTSPVEYKYRAIAKSTAQSRRFREFVNLREPTRPADFISGSWNSYSSEA